MTYPWLATVAQRLRAELLLVTDVQVEATGWGGQAIIRVTTLHGETVERAVDAAWLRDDAAQELLSQECQRAVDHSVHRIQQERWSAARAAGGWLALVRWGVTNVWWTRCPVDAQGQPCGVWTWEGPLREAQEAGVPLHSPGWPATWARRNSLLLRLCAVNSAMRMVEYRVAAVIDEKERADEPTAQPVIADES